jgi:2-polyprenyl-6-methoxyphenol hydroxylase-like FAD-dependent oxidoreductase
MNVILVGGGIGGLTAALWLHRVGIRCRVYEACQEYSPLGVGINLQPHAVKELAELGLTAALRHRGVVIQERAFFNSHGQLIYREPVGGFAGLAHPHLTILRSDLHDILHNAVVERLGRDALVMGHRCTEIAQDGAAVVARFVDADGGGAPVALSADVAVGCDGLHSVVRSRFHPHEPAPLYCGKTSWRGLARGKAFLSGASVAFVGAYNTGMVAAYPVRKFPDGTQLINLIACLPKPNPIHGDFDRHGRLEDFIHHFTGWTFDWLDVPRLFAGADGVLELPLVDRDPIQRWTFGRVTLLGDAAHPMNPRGGNGAAQAIIDAATLARCLASEGLASEGLASEGLASEGLASGSNPVVALQAYEARRRPATSNIVLANRQNPPDTIIEKVEARTGGKRFGAIETVATSDELRAISRNYQRVTGAFES